MTLSLIAGLLAGAGHALSGPDHLAAILPLAMGRGRAAALSGLSWGLGHGVGLLISGALVLAGRAALGAEALSGHAESLVGVLLVVTGFYALVQARRASVEETSPHRHYTAAGIGVVHGAAGMAHVVVLVAALALPGLAATAWLLAFTLGAGVAVATAALVIQRLYQGVATEWAARVRGAGGLLTIGVGVFWLATT